MKIPISPKVIIIMLTTITLVMLIIDTALVVVIRNYQKRDKYANFNQIRAKEIEARSYGQ